MRPHSRLGREGNHSRPALQDIEEPPHDPGLEAGEDLDKGGGPLQLCHHHQKPKTDAIHTHHHLATLGTARPRGQMGRRVLVSQAHAPVGRLDMATLQCRTES